MASSVNVDIVPEDHHCTLCTHILSDPVLTDCCGQLFCHDCLTEWLQMQKTCPHCREANFKFIVDKRMKRVIDSLKIYCPNRSKGCDEITALGECNKHLKKCLFVEVSCTKKCGERILRKELRYHEDNKCPDRLVQCQYCKKNGMHKKVTSKSHLDTCPCLSISCPNNCGHEQMQRKNLAGHQKVCPLEPVKCPFFEAGCTKTILRKNLIAHKASNKERHLELVMTQTARLKQKANKCEMKLEQLTFKFDALVSCVTNQLSTIDSDPRTQAVIKNIKSSLETMTTMLAPGDTQYYLPLFKESENKARSASFYIKPGYKMYVNMFANEHFWIYLEKGEHDYQIKWPIPGMKIILCTTENKILYSETICIRCGHTVNQLEGDRVRQDITNSEQSEWRSFMWEDKKDFVFLTIHKHIC